MGRVGSLRRLTFKRKLLQMLLSYLSRYGTQSLKTSTEIIHQLVGVKSFAGWSIAQLLR